MITGFPELEYEEQERELEVGPTANSLEFLKMVYRNNRLPLPTRMRAAFACLKHEVPALGITAVVSGDDIATLLDQRIARLAQMEQQKQIEQAKPAPQIEARPQQIETKRPPVHTNDRRFRRV